MYVEDMTVVILDRPRHVKLVEEVRRSGARIKLIADGDVSAALATTMPEAGIDLLLGIGRAPQGIIAAAALSLPRRRHAGAAACRATSSRPGSAGRSASSTCSRKYTLEQLAAGIGDVRGHRRDAGRLPGRRALRAAAARSPTRS